MFSFFQQGNQATNSFKTPIFETPEKASTPKPEPEQEATTVPAVTAASTPATAVPENKPTPTVAPVKPTEQPQAGVDLAACLAQNRDFVAWITIPGTKIDYPVVRSDNTEYYLHHLFTGKESKLGSLFSLKSSDYQTPSKNIPCSFSFVCSHVMLMLTCIFS